MTKNALRLEGAVDLDKALAELPSKATGRNVLLRVLKKRGKPIADDAKAHVAVDEGELRDSIGVSTKLSNKVGKAEFRAALVAGLGKAAARQALIAARRASKKWLALIHVGPGDVRHAHMIEFGTSRQAPRPFLRPAWDRAKRTILDGISKDIWVEIRKTVARAAKRRAKKRLKALG